MTDETLIDYALNQQPTKFGDAVNAMLQQKAMDALEQLRGNVAYSMYGEEEAPEEQIGDGVEELSLDDDDDADEFEEDQEFEDTDDLDLEDMLDDLDLDAELEGLDDEDA
jgi:hypothetical protein